MILPVPENFTPWAKYPLTWTLVALNIFIFVLIFNGRSEDYESQRILQTDEVVVTGKLYLQYLQHLPAEQWQSKPLWIRSMKSQNSDQMETLGAYALRDADFMQAADNMAFQGDEVRIESWKQELTQFKDYYFHQIIFLFGLHSFENRPLSWITYQFSHSGWLHLFSNLVFLIVMAMAVEALAGSWMLIFVYLLGGAAGGMVFLLMNSHGAVPMVGASASVSALLAFYCVIEPRRRVRYAYFISPLPNQYGFVYLPTYLIFPLFLLVDFGSLLSTPEGLGSGVAYSAHIGGTLFGLLLGAAYRYRPHPKPLTKS